MDREDKKRKGLSASFVTGAVALVFLIVGYQVALFLNRTAISKILADRSSPDTVYIAYTIEGNVQTAKEQAAPWTGSVGLLEMGLPGTGPTKPEQPGTELMESEPAASPIESGLPKTGLMETGTMEPGAAGKSPTRISESSPMPRDTG